MKKVTIFIMTILAIAGMMTSCNSCKHNEDADMLTSLNFDSIVRADYEIMCDSVNGTDDSVVFFEAGAWFDTVICADTNHNVVKIETVFQTPDSVIMIFHSLVNGNQVDSISTVCSRWLEDCKTTPYNNVSLDSAITCLGDAKTTINSNYVVMRRPLNPKYMNSNYYIFGNVSSWITINATTGEIVNGFNAPVARLKESK